MSKILRALLVGTASTLAIAPAMAQTAPTPRERELEARLEALESSVTELRQALQQERQAHAAAPARPAPAATAAAPQDGFSVGGTTVKVNGFIKVWASASGYSDGDIAGNTSGRDFYLPSAIPIGGKSAGESFEAHAKQTRLMVSTSTPVAGHTLKGLVEADFQATPGTGNQRITNAYNLALRRAYIAFDDFLVGQEWTNFQYVPALPETTDYVGPTEGTVFARQVQLRWTKPLSKHATLSLSAENPATTTGTIAAPTPNENSNDRMPDWTARLTFSGKFGELSFAGVARDLSVDTGAASDSAFAWGLSAAGKLVFGPSHRHDLRFMITHGEGIGRYVGLNFAPDAMLVTRPGAIELRPVTATAGFAALRLGWTDRLRSTVMGSWQRVAYPDGLPLGGANRQAWSAAANLFYSPVKQLDFGIEYRHGERELVSGASGSLDRAELAAKYSF